MPHRFESFCSNSYRMNRSAARLLRVTIWSGLIMVMGITSACSTVAIQGTTRFSRELVSRDPELHTRLVQNLQKAERHAAKNPDDPEAMIWVGRRLGYLWQMNDAIDVYSEGIRRFPQRAEFYRHRGHRYLSIRNFEQAVDDFGHAEMLARDTPDVIEADGMPNERNIPLSSLKFNIWYHLGVCHFVEGNFEDAAIAFSRAKRFSRGFADNLVAVSDWLYLAYRNLDQDEKAQEVLEGIREDLDIIENEAYHRRLLMYKGLIPPEDVIPTDEDDPLKIATSGYGVACWLLLEGRIDEGKKLLREVIQSPYWPAFGVIAAEAEWSRRFREPPGIDDGVR